MGQDIFRTACQGNISRLDSLLETHDLQETNGTGSSLLHIAAYCRQEKVVEFLLKKGAKVTVSNKYGDTPLLYAAQAANAKVLKLLLDKGAEVNKINTEGHTPLFNAVQSDDKEKFDLLLSAGADVNLGTSALHRAVLNGNLYFIQNLINAETELDPLNELGNTPLAIALRQGSMEIAEFLIWKGADRSKIPSYTLMGEYLGQEKPGTTAEVFAPNFISTENFTHTPAFSPDAKRFYYTLESRLYHGGTIMVSSSEEGKWSKPVPANILGDFREIDPFITSDGSAMYYSSDRPAQEGDTVNGNIDLWMVKRDGESWGSPLHLGEKVNTADADWFPTVSDKGTLFFSTGPGRSSNIVYSVFKNGQYQKAITLSDSVNSSYRDYDPYIAPDESYVIFSSNRPDGFGSVDLYISFKHADGSWSKAKNMGESVNSSTGEFASRVSPDGKYLFFNRRGDIYWVDAKVIQDLSVPANR